MFKILNEGEWKTLQKVRLMALKDSPAAFMSNHAREAGYSEFKWRSEFTRGEWIIAFQESGIVGLIGITQDPGVAPDERYLEYLWVSPMARKLGVGSALISKAVSRAREAGSTKVRLWVLEGNETAHRLYRSLGFDDVGKKQELHLEDRPGLLLHEELMEKNLLESP